MALHFHSLTVADVSRETDDAVCIRFDVPPALRPAFAFEPGQHLTLRVTVDGEEQRRSYSLCSAANGTDWSVGIRELPGGKVSTWANRTLRAGDTVECMAPDGTFRAPVDPSHAKHYLLVAAGSGITPLLSIARTVLAGEPRSQVTLLYGNRKLSSVMFREALEDLKNRYLDRLALHYVFSREAQELPIYEGRLDAARLRLFLQTLVPAASIDEAFLCGPDAMLDELEGALRDAGVPAAHVHVERFGTAVAAPAAARTSDAANATDARVTVMADGMTREFQLPGTGVSILDAAREAGLDLPFSCKSGVCSTCRARLKEGTVEMTRNFALMQSDLDAGFILTCQAHPTSARVVVDFDDR